MRPLHERMLDMVAEERRRLASRRGIVIGSAKLAGGGALALAYGGAAVHGRQRARAQDFEDDLDILNYALTLEHLEFAFYRDGLEEFAADDFDDGVYAELEAIRDHEGAHVDALTATIEDLDGDPAQEQEYDFGYEDAAGFLKVAMALENTGVAAYAGAAPSIENDEILAAVLGIHSVEARHAAYLSVLNGESAFPNAVDGALDRDQVLAIAGPFVVSAQSEATPEGAAGGDTAEVSIDDYEFVPEMLAIAVGTTVTFTNNGAVVHSAIADDGSFDTDTLVPDASAAITFDTVGAFPYVCRFHPSRMKGTIVVG